MKRNTIAICLIFLFVLVSLCGCNEPNEPVTNGEVTGRTDLFHLVEYSIESYTMDIEGNYVKVGDGFIHKPSTLKYDIVGKIENIADHQVDLDFIVHYYDKDNNQFDTYKMNINKLDPGEIRGFYNTLHRDSVTFFDSLDKVTFEFVED